MANQYVSSAELKKTLSLTGESFADDDIELAVSAASRVIDNATDRRFWLDDDATSIRYFTANTCGEVLIDDLVVLTSLATDSDLSRTFATAWTVGTDFLLEPFNAVAEGRPYTSIRLQPVPHTGVYLPSYRGAIKVTGQFGWPSVPDEIVQATKLVASRLLKRAREAPFGVVGFGLDNATVRISSRDSDVQELIADYRRPVFVG